MTLAIEFILAFLCAALLLSLSRVVFSRLVSPCQQGAVPVFAVVPSVGDGEGLEQTLRHLHWLREEKLSCFTVLVVNGGLTPAGLETVQALARKYPSLLFCPAEEATLILNLDESSSVNP